MRRPNLRVLLLATLVGHGAAAAGELGPNVTVELSSFLTVFLEDPAPSEVAGVEVDGDRVEALSVLSVRADQPLTERLTLNVAGHLAYGSGADDAEGVVPFLHRDDYRPAYATLTAANVVRYGEVADVLVGKAGLAIGVATLYSPVDERYGAVNRANPVRPLDLGVWQARTTGYVGDDAVSYTLMPFWERDALPGPESRWLGGAPREEFLLGRGDIGTPLGSLGGAQVEELLLGGDGIGTALRSLTGLRPEELLFVGLAPETRIETDQPSLAPRDWGHLLEYRGVRAGHDFFGAIHYGPTRFPVLRQDEPAGTAALEFPSVVTGSGGVVATRGPWRLATEAVAQFSPEGRDQDYLRGIVEIERRVTGLAQRLGLTEVRPAVGFVADVVLAEPSDADYVQSSERARPLRNSLLGRVAVQINPDLKLELGGSVAVGHHETSWAVGFEYRFDDSRRMLVGVRGFGGDDDTYFGRWRDNDLVETGFVWTF